MFLVQILLPLHDNHGQPFDADEYLKLRSELTERFGGLTVHTRAPAEGLWMQNGSLTSRDDIVIFEVMATVLDGNWWREYRQVLQDRFRQEVIIVRAQQIQLL